MNKVARGEKKQNNNCPLDCRHVFVLFFFSASSLIATKYDRLAPSLRLWALCGIVKTFRLGQIQDKSSHSMFEREREDNAAGGRQKKTGGDGGGIGGLKFQLQTAVVSRGSEGFPGWRCSNGVVLI